MVYNENTQYFKLINIIYALKDENLTNCQV